MSILSKNRIKYIRSLELKKIRKEEKVFLAEGPKLVGDVLGYFPCKLLIATSDWLEEHPAVKAAEVIEVTSVLPIGSELSTFFVRPTQLMCSIPRQYKPLWEELPE